VTAVDDLATWLDQILKEDAARLSAPTFCGPVWPTTDQMLARIAADRQILALHEPTGAQLGPHHPVTACSVCGHPGSGVVTVYPCQTVRLLALPHADRPGYQEGWRPA
jgi:hypothetical protein